MADFPYIEPGELTDGVISLALKRYTEDVDAAKQHVPYYEFDVIDVCSGEVAGGLVLRAGYNPHIDNCAGNVGYGIDEKFRGMRYAARAAALVAMFASELGMPYLIITTRPDNEASARTAVIAGYSYLGQAAVPEDDEMYAEGERMMSVFKLKLCRHDARWN